VSRVNEQKVKVAGGYLMVVQYGERTASISDLISGGGALTFLVLRSTQAPVLVRLAAC